ncbi:hypothetical protein LCGC14_1930310, partial [marine sediment metagenome]
IMYTDKEESNKAAKERMRNMRERRNKEGVTDLPDYIKQNIACTVKS